jgi:hypothetical protein
MSIEKFTGSFEKEDLGCTIIVNTTIRNIRNGFVLGVYCYLLTKPSSWKVNVKELQTHFNAGREKIRGSLNNLIDLKLLERFNVTVNNLLHGHHYVLYLKPHINPVNNRGTDFQALENPSTYKTNILPLENKEINTNSESNDSPVTAIKAKSKKQPSVELMELIDIYREEFPNNPQPHKTLISTSLGKTLQTLIKRWPEAEPNNLPLNLESFRRYMKALKELSPRFALNEYETPDGRRKKNRLETFTRWNTFVKFLEGAYS